jgi:hypothetical protein
MRMKRQCSVCVRVPFSLLNHMADLTTLIFILLTQMRFYVPSQTCKKELLASSRLSVYPFTWNNFVPTAWTFMKFNTSVFFENMP